MVISSTLVYYFVDSNLRVKLLLEKEETAKNGGTDSEIGDIETSAYLYWEQKKISCRVWLHFYCFLATRKSF